MILSSKPLAIVEAADFAKGGDGTRSVDKYFKDFVKADLNQAKKIREALVALNNPKIKESSIVKVIDFLPVDSEDVHKIFNDVSLSEEEVNTILNIVKK
ncbi:MAG: hypothetical protein AABX66_03170 [Nanoarchaeota archaeon]